MMVSILATLGSLASHINNCLGLALGSLLLGRSRLGLQQTVERLADWTGQISWQIPTGKNMYYTMNRFIF